MAGHSHHDHDHAHNCGHDHGHGGHSHAPKVSETNLRRVGFAAILTGLFMVVEIVGGLISGSLALLADAGHMMTDFAALAMAWGAFKLAQRPADPRHTFGYDRVSILVAFVNGVTLFGVAAWIVFEAVQRFRDPSEVLAGTMLWIAITGLIVNLIVFRILMGADQHNLNIRGAMLHVLGDLLGSVAAIAAAVIIMFTGWTLADPLLSVLVAILILRSAYGLVKASVHILLQGAPDGLDPQAIEVDLLSHIPELHCVDTLHVWAVTQERIVLTLNGGVDGGADIATVTAAIKARLEARYQMDQITIELTPH